MKIIDLTPENIAEYGVCGYKNVKKHKELSRKIAWFKEYYSKGLRIKALIGEDESYQGMLEYIPGKYAHRPVNAQGYMFIHCLFVGFNKEYKGHGHATNMIQTCIDDARSQGMKGVSIVTRKGSFMVDKPIFLNYGFEVVDTAPPDFELLVHKFDQKSESPSFRTEAFEKSADHSEGLTIMRSPQCPYTEKNVMGILQAAEEKYGLETHLIDIASAEEAQKTPCAFGTFCMLHQGEVISHHPTSKGRFENIMKKRLAEE